VFLDGTTTNGVPHDAAAAVYDALVRLLHTSVRTVLSLSIVVIVAAVFAGPSRFAVWFRSSVCRAAGWLGRESDSAGWRVLSSKAFFVAHKGAMRVTVAAVMFVVLFRWDRPTPMVVFWIVVVTLLLLAIVEFFGREVTDQAEIGQAA
jgi:hypothetical protein